MKAQSFKTAVTVAAIVALAVLAWFAGDWVGAQSHQKGGASPTTLNRQEVQTPPAETIVARAASLHSQRGGFARRRDLLLLAEHARPADIRAMLEGGFFSVVDAIDLIKRWADSDPAAAWQWYSAGGKRFLDQISVTNSIFSRWFESDPRGALTAFRAANWRDRGLAANGIMSHLFSDEPALRDAAIGALDELASVAAGDMSQWGGSKKAPEFATKLMALPEGSARSKLIRSFAKGFFDLDWEAALAWAKQLPAPDGKACLESFAATALDTRGRVVYAANKDRKEPGPERFQWGRQWLESESDSSNRAHLGPSMVREWAKTDAAAALAWAGQHLGGASLARAVAEIVQQKALGNREEAIALIDSLPPGGVRMQAAAQMAMVWSQKEPSAAVSWLIEQGKDAVTTSGWSHLGSQWAFQQPEAFKSYLANASSLPPEAFIRSAVYNLIRKDSAGTVQWAATLGPSTRQIALGSALAAWSYENVQAAAQAIITSKLSNVPETTLKQIALNYFDRDADAAIDWARQLPGSSEKSVAVAALLKRAEKLPEESRDAIVQKLR